MSYTIPTNNSWPVVLPDATETTDGLMSAADKAKLDGLSGIVFIYRPGGTAGENVYSDWLSLYEATLNVQGNYVIQIDSSLASATVPVGIWDLGLRCTLAPISTYVGSPPDPNSFTRLTLDDGAVLRNLASMRGPVTLAANSATTPGLDFTSDVLLLLSEGAHVLNFGSCPVLRVSTPGQSVVVFFNFSAGYDSPVNAPFMDLSAPGIQTIFLVYNQINFGTTSFITGVPGSVLIFLYDASTYPPPCPGFLGFSLFQPSDQSENVFFNDFLTFPQLGSDNVQGAIDVLKASRTLRGSYEAAVANADNTLDLDPTKGGLRLNEPNPPTLGSEPMLHLISNTGFPILQVVTDSYPGLPFSGTGRGGVGFLGHAPCGLYTPSGATGAVTVGVGATVTEDTLFTGTIGTTAYTIGEIVDALKMYGFLKE